MYAGINIDLELNQGTNFIHWITLGDFRLSERPDRERASRKGGHPDFKFVDNSGKEYVIEYTRLLNKTLRNLEHFAESHIAIPLQGKLPGTYKLEIMVDQIGRGWITVEMANLIISEIEALIQSGFQDKIYQLSNGFTLQKVREDGNRLVPWLIGMTLPADLHNNDPIARELEKEFHNIVQSSDRKLEGYLGARILLLGLSQSGLDCEFHAQHFKDSQGVMLTWADKEGKTLKNLDYIYLEPGINVWAGSSNNLHVKVFAGHKYIDGKASYYPLLWQRPGNSNPSSLVILSDY